MAGGANVSGMTVEEAQKAVSRWWGKCRSESLVLSNQEAMGGDTLSISPEDMGVAVDPVKTVAACAKQNPLVRIPGAASVNASSVATVRWSIDSGRYQAFLRKLTAYNKEPGQPRIRYDDGAISVVRATPGLMLEKDKVLGQIEIASLTGEDSVRVPFKVADQTERELELSRIKEEIASWSTSFRGSSRSRCHNIRLATGFIDGMVLLPGEVFSYNGTVGRRTAARGFRLAPTFVKGQHVDDFGGGICQVSSTLYNAVLLSGLKIVERHNHQMVVGYVPLGRDATVNFGNKDLKFENSTGGPIAIIGEYRPGRITMRILGEAKDPDAEVKLIVTDRKAYPYTVETVTDPTMRMGAKKVVEKGGRGFRCRSWRFFYRNGELVKKELLGSNYYMPSTRIVKQGPLKTEPAEEPAPTDAVQISRSNSSSAHS